MEYIKATEVAKMIRKDLKAKWPGTKFSVVTDQYAGGCSIRVRYENGPALRDVNFVKDLYAGRGFDGMIDLDYYYRFARNTATGEILCLGTDGTQGSGGVVPNTLIDVPEGFEEVRLAGAFVFVERKLTAEYRERGKVAWAQLDGQEQCDAFNDNRFPRCYETDGENLAGFLGEDDMTRLEEVLAERAELDDQAAAREAGYFPADYADANAF